MTVPDEEMAALEMTRLLLLDLIDAANTPRIPKQIRERARRCLRHYPMRHRVEDLYGTDAKAIEYREAGLGRKK